MSVSIIITTSSDRRVRITRFNAEEEIIEPDQTVTIECRDSISMTFESLGLAGAATYEGEPERY